VASPSSQSSHGSSHISTTEEAENPRQARGASCLDLRPSRRDHRARARPVPGHLEHLTEFSTSPAHRSPEHQLLPLRGNPEELQGRRRSTRLLADHLDDPRVHGVWHGPFDGHGPVGGARRSKGVPGTLARAGTHAVPICHAGDRSRFRLAAHAESDVRDRQRVDRRGGRATHRLPGHPLLRALPVSRW